MNYIKTINLFIILLFIIFIFSMTVVSASDNETLYIIAEKLISYYLTILVLN